MTSYKLTYFNITAVAEPIRFLLSYGKKEFEDVRIELGDPNWTNLKPGFPMGQVPILEIDEKVTHQHLAICRYLAKQFGLAGDNDLEALEIDAMADTVNDFRLKMYQTYWEPDEQLKEKYYKTAVETTLPFYLGKLNDFAESGYLANGKLSWADLYLVAFLNYFNLLARFTIVEKYPNIQKVKENVENIPEIKAWIEKRPATKF